MQRRDFLKMAGAIGLAVPIAAACEITRVDFGALDSSGVANLLVPAGFTARKLATSGQVVKRSDNSDTSYTWHPNPDGGGVFPILTPAPDGVSSPSLTGWIYTSNSERTSAGSAVGALRFDAAGNVVDAYSIHQGAQNNCAGGVIPTTSGFRWVTCEEREDGFAVECDPYQPGDGIERPAMGRFYREAVAADPVNHRIYQTEDRSDGCFYRFTPTTWGDLSSGLLEVMTDLGGGAVGWATVPDPDGNPTNTRSQDVGATKKVFNGGEGCWYTDGSVYFTTKGDNRVWRYATDTDVLTVVYDDSGGSFANPRHLTGADNVVATTTNRVFVAEDGGNMEIVGLDVATGATYPIIRYAVSGSEITGPAFSPDGSRLYFSSQRNPGETFEVTGPWNLNAPEA